MKYETRSKNCYCVQCGGWAAPPPPNHRKDQGSVLRDHARVPNAAWNGPPHQEGTRVPQPT